MTPQYDLERHNILNTWLGRLQGKKILIVTHVQPDADAVGAVISAWLLIMPRYGMQAHIYLEPSVSNDLFEMTAERIPPYDHKGLMADLFVGVDPDERYQGLMVLDCARADRVALPEGMRLDDHSNVLNIDHHESNPEFGLCNIVDTKAASTCSILGHIWRDMLPRVPAQNPALAHALAVGLLGDTGGFRYSNTTRTSLGFAAFLSDMGADIYSIIQRMYVKQTPKEIELKALLYSNIGVSKDRRVAWLMTNETMLSEFDVTDTDAKNLVNIPRSLEGVLVAFRLHDNHDGTCRVSLRSDDDEYPVNRVAAAFLGGGHIQAAGATLQGNGEQCLARLREKITEILRIGY